VPLERPRLVKAVAVFCMEFQSETAAFRISSELYALHRERICETLLP
jgi:hypothetical protein